MSNWIPNCSVTINGTNYDALTLRGVQISYGRTSIWDQPRAGYAVVNILNTTDTDYAFQPNQSVVITIDDSTGTAKTVFSGKITEISNSLRGAGSIGTAVVQSIVAVSPLAKMARDTISADFAKEYDNIRMDNILTAAGVTKDVVDSGVYEFQAITGGTGDAYSLGAKYAGQSFGYIYDTTDGKIGWANESRRFIDQRDNGYLSIPISALLERDVSSTKSVINLLNDLILSYRAGSVTSSDATSQASYGLAAGTISTELHNASDAQLQADRYIALRATPRTNLGQISLALETDVVTSTVLDGMVNMYHGKPIQIASLPIGIKNSTYRGFVEGWTWQIGYKTCQITLISTDATLSIVPTRWQDVLATTKWSDVGALVQWATYDD